MKASAIGLSMAAKIVAAILAKRVAAAVPAFLLLARLAPWGEQEARGAFDPSRDAT